MTPTTTLRKTGEIARELCRNYTEVADYIALHAIRPVMVIDGTARYDDAAFEKIAAGMAEKTKGEPVNG